MKSKSGVISLYFALFCLTVFVLLGFSSGVVFAAAAVCFSLSAVILLVISRMFRRQRTGAVLKAAAFSFIACLIGTAVAFNAAASVRAPSARLLEKYSGSSEPILLTVRIDDVIATQETYGIYDCLLILADGKSTAAEFGAFPVIRLSAFGKSTLEKGDVVEFSGTLSIPEEITEDGFRQRVYLESREIFISCRAEGQFRIIAHELPGAVQRLRSRMSAGLIRYIPAGEDGALRNVARCILLGERQAPDKKTESIFRASGASHVLSVSGMHLSVLFAIIYAAFVRLRRGRRRFPAYELISCALALLYMAITGFSPSIMRAGFMLIIANLFNVCTYYKRKLAPGLKSADDGSAALLTAADVFVSFTGAAAAICFIAPYSLYDIGMQLSLLSTLGLLVSAPVCRWITKHIKSRLLSAVFASLASTYFILAFTFPVSVYNFGTVSSVSAFTNIALLPLMTPLLAFLLLLALLSLLPQYGIIQLLCCLLGKISGAVCEACISICSYFARMEFSVVDADVNTAVNVIFAIFIIAAFMLAVFGLKRIAAAAGAAAVVMYSVCFPVYFSKTLSSRLIPRLTCCTVSERPYACISTGSSRLIFDSGRDIASRLHTMTVKGDDLYPTDNYYAVVLSSSTDFKSVYTNISAIRRETDISAVLIPSASALAASGADYSEYCSFLKSLNGNGYNVEFYSSSFSIDGNKFTVDIESDRSAFVSGSFSLIFAGSYDEQYASRISAETRHCVYFCSKAAPTLNTGYTSDAKLYVSSAQQKNVAGALKIPAGKIGILE